MTLRANAWIWLISTQTIFVGTPWMLNVRTNEKNHWQSTNFLFFLFCFHLRPWWRNDVRMISLFPHSLWIYNISWCYSVRLVNVRFHIVLVTCFRNYGKLGEKRTVLSCLVFMRTKTARYLEDVLHKFLPFPVSWKGCEWKKKNMK